MTGLLDNIILSTANIGRGRKNLATDGFEPAGRVDYENGISLASVSFKDAQATADPQTMLLVELTFLQQELHFCNEADTTTISSLILAIQSFEDALRCLKIVENSELYQAAEATYPTASKYRCYGFPRDAVHLSCAAHRTRLQNSLRVPGINMTEKAVITQRTANMTAVQAAYTQKQRKALENK